MERGEERVWMGSGAGASVVLSHTVLYICWLVGEKRAFIESRGMSSSVNEALPRESNAAAAIEDGVKALLLIENTLGERTFSPGKYTCRVTHLPCACRRVISTAGPISFNMQGSTCQSWRLLVVSPPLLPSQPTT